MCCSAFLPHFYLSLWNLCFELIVLIPTTSTSNLQHQRHQHDRLSHLQRHALCLCSAIYILRLKTNMNTIQRIPCRRRRRPNPIFVCFISCVVWCCAGGEKAPAGRPCNPAVRDGDRNSCGLQPSLPRFLLCGRQAKQQQQRRGGGGGGGRPAFHCAPPPSHERAQAPARAGQQGHGPRRRQRSAERCGGQRRGGDGFGRGRARRSGWR